MQIAQLHTILDRLINDLGYTMKDIQTWLGHSNYAFTANTYVHASREEHQKMAQTLSEKLPQLLPGIVESA